MTLEDKPLLSKTGQNTPYHSIYQSSTYITKRRLWCDIGGWGQGYGV